MNILVTLDSGYIRPLSVMLKSLLLAHKTERFRLYVMNTTLAEADYDYLKKSLPTDRISYHDIKVDRSMLGGAPVTDRYPKEMYFRIFAAKFLPETVDKILYLDPDLVVMKPLTSLYNTDLGNRYFAAASHVGNILTKVNNIRLNTEEEGPYINSGVMLMNIDLLRKEQDFSRVLNYIEKYKSMFILPDQDVISGVYGEKIKEIDPFVYNMTERLLVHPQAIENKIDLGWVAANTAIIHFCGRNKPWKENYLGLLGFIWHYMDNIKVE